MASFFSSVKEGLRSVATHFGLASPVPVSLKTNALSGALLSIPNKMEIPTLMNTSYSAIPTSVNTLVMSYLFPIEMTRERMQGALYEMALLSTLGQSDRQMYEIIIEEIQELWAIITKYPDHKQYQTAYANVKNTPNISGTNGAFGLFALVNNSYKNQFITPEHTIDIERITTLLPISVHCDLGTTRCRNYMTPLEVACVNSNIPLSIIEFLINNGSNLYHTYECDGFCTHILVDMDIAGIDQTRKTNITKLFADRGVTKQSVIAYRVNFLQNLHMVGKLTRKILHKEDAAVLDQLCTENSAIQLLLCS
jgi:hypothetical protein